MNSVNWRRVVTKHATTKNWGGRKTSENLSKEKINLLKESGYSEKAIKLYSNRVNVGVIENPDVVLVYEGFCGDSLKLYLKIKGDLIEDAKFQYLGCPGSVACGSMMTQLIKGKTLAESKEITEKDILAELDGLPGDESHCAELAVKTLHKTLMKYDKTLKSMRKMHQRKKKPLPRPKR